jgi:hypothetical protein
MSSGDAQTERTGRVTAHAHAHRGDRDVAGAGDGDGSRRLLAGASRGIWQHLNFCPSCHSAASELPDDAGEFEFPAELTAGGLLVGWPGAQPPVATPSGTGYVSYPYGYDRDPWGDCTNDANDQPGFRSKIELGLVADEDVWLNNEVGAALCTDNSDLAAASLRWANLAPDCDVQNPIVDAAIGASSGFFEVQLRPPSLVRWTDSA